LTLVAAEVAEKPASEELKRAVTYINLKDAPIVAAAAKAKVDYLVTWDRKHFVDDPKVTERSGLMILTPDRLMVILKKTDDLDSL
jgi:predicted nucleic acid-binding protein